MLRRKGITSKASENVCMIKAIPRDIVNSIGFCTFLFLGIIDIIKSFPYKVSCFVVGMLSQNPGKIFFSALLYNFRIFSTSSDSYLTTRMFWMLLWTSFLPYFFQFCCASDWRFRTQLDSYNCLYKQKSINFSEIWSWPFSLLPYQRSAFCKELKKLKYERNKQCWCNSYHTTIT